MLRRPSLTRRHISLRISFRQSLFGPRPRRFPARAQPVLRIASANNQYVHPGRLNEHSLENRKWMATRRISSNLGSQLVPNYHKTRKDTMRQMKIHYEGRRLKQSTGIVESTRQTPDSLVRDLHLEGKEDARSKRPEDRKRRVYSR